MTMDTTYKQKLRRPSLSNSESKVALGKTPLERMYQVAELGRRGRLIEQLAYGRATDTGRAR